MKPLFGTQHIFGTPDSVETTRDNPLTDSQEKQIAAVESRTNRSAVPFQDGDALTVTLIRNFGTSDQASIKEETIQLANRILGERAIAPVLDNILRNFTQFQMNATGGGRTIVKMDIGPEKAKDAYFPLTIISLNQPMFSLKAIGSGKPVELPRVRLPSIQSTQDAIRQAVRQAQEAINEEVPPTLLEEAEVTVDTPQPEEVADIQIIEDAPPPAVEVIEDAARPSELAIVPSEGTQDVEILSAGGKGMSTTSKLLIGAGLVGAVALGYHAYKNRK